MHETELRILRKVIEDIYAERARGPKASHGNSSEPAPAKKNNASPRTKSNAPAGA